MQEERNVEVVIKHLNMNHQNSESCPLSKAKNIYKKFQLTQILRCFEPLYFTDGTKSFLLGLKDGIRQEAVMILHYKKWENCLR